LAGVRIIRRLSRRSSTLQLSAEAAEDMVIFHLLLQPPDLLRLSEFAADRFSLHFKWIEGVSIE